MCHSFLQFRLNVKQSRYPHAHGRVALLQFVPITLKTLKPKESDFLAETLGQHVRKRRLALKLTQKEIANRLGVDPLTVLNWEKGHTKPPIDSTPAIVRLLGYEPDPPSSRTLEDSLKAKRREFGWSQATAALKLGVDPCTWSDWEKGGTILAKTHRNMIARFLGMPASDVYCAMRKRWNTSHRRPTTK